MANFRYIALDGEGRRLSGVLSVATAAAALAELEQRQLTPVELKEQRAAMTLPWSGDQLRISQIRLGTAYQQVADLLKAGVPLLRSLRLIANQKSSPKLAKIFGELAEAVEDGETLADSMEKRLEVFHRVHIAMVRAGERGGFLEEVLARLGQFVIGQVELRQKVIGSLIYPGVIAGAGLIAVILIFGVFVPRFEIIFEELPRLPFATRTVFAVSSFLGDYWVIAVVALFLGVAGLWHGWRREHLRLQLASTLIRTPVIGTLLKQLSVARFCRMLGTLLANGVPMISSLQIARDAAGNPILERGIEQATESVRAGEPLATPLGETGLFDSDVLEMISVAESANNLDEILVTIADTVERRVERLLLTAVRLIEPLTLLLLALFIGFVAAALILPMLQLTAEIGSGV